MRKVCSVINALLPMSEEWRESLDDGGALGTRLTDLSKAFNCFPHELLITKFYTYGNDVPFLKLIHPCLALYLDHPC